MSKLVLGSLNSYLTVNNQKSKIQSYIYIKNQETVTQQNLDDISCQLYTFFPNSYAIAPILTILENKNFLSSNLGYSNLFYNNQDVLPALTLFFKTLKTTFDLTSHIVIHTPQLSFCQYKAIKTALTLAGLNFQIYQFQPTPNCLFLDFSTLYPFFTHSIAPLLPLEAVSSGSIFQLIANNFSQFLTSQLQATQICRDLGCSEGFLRQFPGISISEYGFFKINSQVLTAKFQDIGLDTLLEGEISNCVQFLPYEKAEFYKKVEKNQLVSGVAEPNGVQKVKVTGVSRGVNFIFYKQEQVRFDYKIVKYYDEMLIIGGDVMVLVEQAV